MIVNVRGTHGAGKTTLVKAIMERYKRVEPIMVDKRKRPLGYICTRKGSKLFIPGAYDESFATGGCDTIQILDLIYKLIRQHAKKGYDVLFEGIVAQHSTPNIVRLTELGYEVAIVVIDIPLEKAIKSVKRRRKEKGDKRKFNPFNMTNEARAVLSTAGRLKEMGVIVKYPKTRRAAMDRTLKLLGLE